MQETGSFKEFETGKEKVATIEFKIERDGWPSLECQEVRDVLGDGEARKMEANCGVTGHSYSSFLVLPWSNWVPVLRSFT